MLKAVIFDMDGVLVNTEPMHYEAFKMFLGDYGMHVEYETYAPLIGSTIPKLIELVREGYKVKIPEDQIRREFQKKKEILIEERGFEPIDGIYELLVGLKKAGLKLAVASSSGFEYILRVTKAIGIFKFFDVIVSGEGLEHPKPAPDIFQISLEQLNITAEECLVIEDSTNGVKSACAAGIPCIGYETANSGRQDLSLAVMIVQGFEEVDYSFIANVYRRAHGLPQVIAVSERLILREITVADVEELFLMYQNPSITRYMEGLRETLEEEQEYTRSYISNMYEFCGYGYWAVLEREHGNLIGRAGLQYRKLGQEAVIEIGYMIGVPYQRKGYAMEACSLVLDFAAQKLDIDKVHALIHRENLPSVNLAVKLGFKCVGDVFIENNKLKHFEYTL